MKSIEEVLYSNFSNFLYFDIDFYISANFRIMHASCLSKNAVH